MPEQQKPKSTKDALLLYGGSFLIVIIAFAVTFHFVKPAPPTTIRMATGSQDNIYYQLGLQYQQRLKQQGIDLEIITTEGSIHNLQLLQDHQVDIAFMQSGINANEATEFRSLGSLYFEPLWLFYRKDLQLNLLSDLKGHRVAIGSPGSGTQAISLTLLNDNGLDPATVSLLETNSQNSIQALSNGDADAAFLVTGPNNIAIQQLLADPSLQLYSFKRADAYTRLYPYLSSVTLPTGVMNLAKNIPDQNIQLLAPTATLVIKPDFHPALASLILQTATKIHQGSGILESRNQFPSPEYVDFPLSEEASRYYQSGAPFLQRYLPFWLANLVDRLIVLLIPLVTLMIPLMKVLPPTYRWRIRSRIYRWYDQLRDIEHQAEGLSENSDIKQLLDDLSIIEKELMMTDIPKSYAESQYNLRLHIRLIRERLDLQLKDN